MEGCVHSNATESTQLWKLCTVMGHVNGKNDLTKTLCQRVTSHRAVKFISKDCQFGKILFNTFSEILFFRKLHHQPIIRKYKHYHFNNN